jgi:hypothetical protein
VKAVDGGADHGHATASERIDEFVCKGGFPDPVDATVFRSITTLSMVVTKTLQHSRRLSRTEPNLAAKKSLRRR